jgi:hypothetical protein
MKDSAINRDRRDAALEAGRALTCAFGYPHIGARPCGSYHCVGCAREGLRLLREFREAVERGELDEEGYTPAERKAKQKKDADSSILW